MIAIVIITKTGHGSNLFDTLRSFGDVHQDGPLRMTAQDRHRWLMLMKDDNVPGEYEPEDLERVHELICDPEFYVLQVNEYSVFDDFINRIEDNKNVIIDNDNGWIDTLQSYKNSIAKGQDWIHFPGPLQNSQI